MNRKKLQIGVLLLWVMLLESCHKNDPNPCSGKQPTTADFTIKEYANKAIYAWPDWQDYNTDTVLGDEVVLTATQDSVRGTTYQWSIGKNTITKRSFTIDFSSRDTVKEKFIPIKLSVFSPPNKDCFPQDSGKASFSKFIVFASQSLTTGKYFGTWNGNDNDTGTVIIYGYTKFQTYLDRPYIPGYAPDSLLAFWSWNLAGDHVTDIAEDIASGYKQFLGVFKPWYVDSYQGLISDFTLTAQLYPDNNSLQIKLSYLSKEDFKTKIEKQFKGKRIH